MKNIRAIFVLSIWLISCTLPIQKICGQQTVTLDIAQPISANFNYKIIDDKNGTFDFKKIIQNKGEIFQKQEYKPKHYLKQTFWCYLQTGSKFKKNDVFVIKCPNTINLQIYAILKSDSSGSVDFINNPYTYRNENFIFELPHNASQAIIKITSSQFISFEITLKIKPLLFKAERNKNIYYGIALGVLLLLFLYHSILYFIVREKLYFYYVMQTLISGIYIALHGLIYFSQLPNIYSQLTFILLQICFVFVFLEYIKLAIINIKAYSLFINLIPLPFIIGLYNISVPSFFSNLLLFAFSIILVVGFIISSIIYYRKNYPVSKFFLSSWSILFLGQCLFFINCLFQHYNSDFLDHSFELGLIFSNVIISLELGNKLNIYKNEKNQAEVSEIIALKEKETFINEQNLILKKLINERNKELLDKIELSIQQKQEIESQNEIINNRIKEIEIINEELIQKNLEISNQNTELEVHHKTLEEIVDKRTKKLIKAKEKAVIADKLKTSFLNNLTQEISTPMNAITGYSSMITDKSLSIEIRNEYLNKILRYVDILLDTVDNIVILSRIQAGVIKPRITETSLTELIYNVKSLFEEKVKTSNKIISLHTDIPVFNNDLYVKTDKDKIWQILNILVDLLIKQKFEGNINIKIEIKRYDDSKQRKKDKLVYDLIFNRFEPSKNKIFNAFENYFNNSQTNLKYNNPIELGIAIIKGLLRISKGKLKLHNLENESYNAKIVFPVYISQVKQKE